MPAKLALIGKQFGNLTVVHEAGRDAGGKVCWACKCLCKKKTIVRGCDLKGGKSKSCGCGKATNRVTHGKCGTKIYAAWINMKTRCYNPNTDAYKNYGGRGITICNQWLNSFEAFYTDMMPTWFIGSELDRKNSDGNYSKKNCRWVTRIQQAQNKRRSISVEGKNLAEIAREYGIKYSTLLHRFKMNYPKEKLLKPPSRREAFR
jgi:hypothetical protein